MKQKNKNNFFLTPFETNDENISKNKFIQFLSAEYLKIQKKSLKSKLLFIFLNLFSFLISTTIVILTLIIIGKKIGTPQVISIFVSISIISAIITFITGVGTLFQFKKRKEIYQTKIQRINEFLKLLEDEKNLDLNIKNISDSLFEYNNDI